MPVLVLVAAVAWTGFWFYAASHVDEKFDEWRTREARSGRAYECANRSVAGFPFRMEVRCGDPVVTLTSQTADRSQLIARLKRRRSSRGGPPAAPAHPVCRRRSASRWCSTILPWIA